MVSKQPLSNVDIIRQFVFKRSVLEQTPVSLAEVGAELRSHLKSIRSEEDAQQRYALPVLKAQSYFRQNGELWEIELEAMPEYKALPEVFREQRQFLYERDVKSKVAQKLGWKVAVVVLELERAEGLQKLGSRWGLAEWHLVNEEAVEVLKQYPGGLSEKDLLKHICERMQISPDIAILQPAIDRRFVSERKLWLLKEQADKKQTQASAAATVPKRKTKDVELVLESGFQEALISTRGDEGGGEDERLVKSRLRKAQVKQAQEILEQREDLQPKQEDFAAKLSQVLSAAGVDDYGVMSFHRVEPAPKERGLEPAERQEMQKFINQLMELETVNTSVSAAAVANAPLSARKMQDVLRLKYAPYTTERAVIPNELYRALIEIVKPSIQQSLLHPSCFEGNLSVELFNYLYEKLEGSAWALTEDDRRVELVQPDGTRFILSGLDKQFIDRARDRFLITQKDLIEFYLSEKYTAIEHNKVLARAGRIITRLSGFENVYIYSNDFLSELPEVFGLDANDENEIPQRFDLVIGNFTFEGDPNLAANYLELSLHLLNQGGRCAVFVLYELLVLLKERALLGEFLQGRAVTHFLRLPQLEGRHNVVALVMESLPAGQRQEQPIVSADIADIKSGIALASALRDGTGKGDLYKTVEPMAVATLIS
ncbi:hypothetical protein IT575_13935 [bacterium]|nr:hypothetical protein [bacterium]